MLQALVQKGNITAGLPLASVDNIYIGITTVLISKKEHQTQCSATKSPGFCLDFCADFARIPPRFLQK